MRSLASVFAAILALVTVVSAGAEEPPPPPADLSPPASASTTDSGLAYVVLAEGDGDHSPDDNDLALVHYTGWTTDGAVFDSSVARGKPALLPLEALIMGWTECLQLMVEGETRRLWIPGALAYEGLEGKPQGMLVFDVELLDIRDIPPVPADVAAPPADAGTTRSGVFYKVLDEGTGTRNPSARDSVEVEYIGWTTDGKWFDSTYSRGETATFPLSGVIQGWREALLLMVEGETRRIWIPENLAYGGEEGKPQGMLVFDVELVAIQ